MKKKLGGWLNAPISTITYYNSHENRCYTKTLITAIPGHILITLFEGGL